MPAYGTTRAQWRSAGYILLFSALLLALVGCGPAAIAVAVGSGGSSSSSSAPPPLSLEANIGQISTVETGRCGLIRQLDLVVNRPNATLTYSVNNGPEQPFVDPFTGVQEPELPANVSTSRRLLLRTGSSTIVVRAAVGAEVVTQTVTLSSTVDPVGIDLEPPDVRGQNMTLRWSLPVGQRPDTFFWVYFDDTANDIDRLAGASGLGASPVLRNAGDLNETVIGDRRHFSLEVPGLASSPDGLMQYHYFAVRAADGCESRVVAAHTRPKPQELSWLQRSNLELATPELKTPLPGGTPASNVEAPIGGEASNNNVVGVPLALIDRGGDDTNFNQQQNIKELDGLEEVVLVSSDAKVYCSLNDSGALQPPLEVDDVETINTGLAECAGLTSGQTGEVIRSFLFDNDGDLRPDLFVATARRVWAYFGDPIVEENSATETQFLNWKKFCTGFIDLPALPAGLQFVDAYHGDFDGDGTADIVTSVGRTPSAADPGVATRIYIWYADRDPAGFASWNWSQNTPLEIELGTLFGDDAYFVPGDVNGDGRDDLLIAQHVGPGDVRFRILLMGTRGAPPQAVLESGNIAADPAKPEEALFANGPSPSIENARWDQTALVDLNHDGVLDVCSLRSRDTFSGAVVAFRGYLTDLQAGTIDTANPFVDASLDSTHARISNPRQRGHLQILDVDGDGLLEVLLRSTQGAIPFRASRLSVYTGSRNPDTGQQDWPAINTSPNVVDFDWLNGEVPHLHFAAADLNFDNVVDFCTVHERPSPPNMAVVIASDAETDFERFVVTPNSFRYPFAGTVRTGGGASTVQVGNVNRVGDLILDVDPTLGVLVAPAQADAGAKNGAFGSVVRRPLQAPLPFPVQEFAVVRRPEVTGDLLVVLDGSPGDDRIGTLEYDAASNSYSFRDEIGIADVTRLYAGYFDPDGRADALVIDGSNTMSLLGTVDENGNRNLDLAVRDSRTLLRAPELLLVDTIADDEFDEVLVVLKDSNTERRDVFEWRVLRDNGSGEPRLAESLGPIQLPRRTFPGEVVSLAAANFNGRFENNLQERKWIVGGMTDGTVMAVPNQQTGAVIEAVPVATIGTGLIDVLAVDVTYDNLPDIVAYERNSSEISVLRCQPNAAEAWRFPNQGSYEFQGTGSFDNIVRLPIPEPLSAFAAARVDNDPYTDLLLLSRSGERLHVFVTRGAQRLR